MAGAAARSPNTVAPATNRTRIGTDRHTTLSQTATADMSRAYGMYTVDEPMRPLDRFGVFICAAQYEAEAVLLVS